MEQLYSFDVALSPVALERSRLTRGDGASKGASVAQGVGDTEADHKVFVVPRVPKECPARSRRCSEEVTIPDDAPHLADRKVGVEQPGDRRIGGDVSEICGGVIVSPGAHVIDWRRRGDEEQLPISRKDNSRIIAVEAVVDDVGIAVGLALPVRPVAAAGGVVAEVLLSADELRDGGMAAVRANHERG